MNGARAMRERRKISVSSVSAENVVRRMLCLDGSVNHEPAILAKFPKPPSNVRGLLRMTELEIAASAQR